MAEPLRLSSNEIEVRLEKRFHAAVAAAQQFKDAIKPLYAYVPHKTSAPEQVASCVLLKLSDSYFVLTAGHALEALKNSPFQIGCGDKLHRISGVAIRSRKKPSKIHEGDELDIGVVRLTSEVPPIFDHSCISLEDIDAEPNSERSFFIIRGFRSKTSRISGRTASTELEMYFTTEHTPERYETLGIDMFCKLGLWHALQIEKEGKLFNTPSPRGMSGGAMLRIKGLPQNLAHLQDAQPRARLSAIFTELRQPSRRLSALVGTRIFFYLRMIARRFPDIDKWIRQVS